MTTGGVTRVLSGLQLFSVVYSSSGAQGPIWTSRVADLIFSGK